MTKSRIQGFLSVVLDLNSLDDVKELFTLISKVDEATKSFEIICVTSEKSVFSNPDLIYLVNSQPNIAIYYLSARTNEDLKFYGLELSLGDYVMELYSSGNRLQDFETLIENFIKQEYKIVQLLPRKVLVKDQILSFIASRALQNKIKTLTLIGRISPREAFVVWNRRKMKHKVFKLATQLSFENTHYVLAGRDKILGEKRFIRVGLRTIIHASGSPLRWVAFAAFGVSLVSLSASVFVVVLGFTRSSIEGWATTNLQISIYSTFVFLAISFFSEYLYQIFENLNETPAIRLVEERISSVYQFNQDSNIEYLSVDKIDE
jgi:hypothetical protein